MIERELTPVQEAAINALQEPFIRYWNNRKKDEIDEGDRKNEVDFDERWEKAFEVGCSSYDVSKRLIEISKPEDRVDVLDLFVADIEERCDTLEELIEEVQVLLTLRNEFQLEDPLSVTGLRNKSSLPC